MKYYMNTFSFCKHICNPLNWSSELPGFWALSTIRYSERKATQRFGNKICFLLQVRGRHIFCLLPVIEVSSFWETQQSMLLPLTWGWKQIPFPKRCVLDFFRIPDAGQSPKIQNRSEYNWINYVQSSSIYELVITVHSLHGVSRVSSPETNHSCNHVYDEKIRFTFMKY
jgi:hypothetical protein